MQGPVPLLALVPPLRALLTWGTGEATAPPSKSLGCRNCKPDLSLHPQVVRALTAMLHRQWLTVRREGGPPRTEQQRRTVRCLRDTVLLLHGLSQKDTLFTVHCVEALHQYDQVMPGVSVLIRGLPDVTDCEGELAGGPLPALAHLCGFPEVHGGVRLPGLASSPPSTTGFASTGVILTFLLRFFSEHIRLPFARIC